jgi:23S rRNA (cytidine2498-2'-O)-methyltransferase
MKDAAARAFVFAICQPAANAWLKADVARLHPGLKLAFSRPGLVTFRAEGSRAASFTLASPFARLSGLSLGRAASPPEVVALLESAHLPSQLRLHVFERDPRDPERFEEEPSVLGSRARAVEAALRNAAPGRFHALAPAELGDLVLDVVLAPAGEPEEPWLVGLHEHTAERSAYPGGPRRIQPPPEAPSRAFAKLEEAADWARLALVPGQLAVELGSAPGGVSLALLLRGLEVVGVDSGEMDPRVLGFAGACGNRFTHLRMAAGAVKSDDLPPRVDWLLTDMNIAPPVALRYVRRLVAMRPPACGLICTLKLNDERMRDALPQLLDKVRQLGLGEPRALQLPSNRSEVTVVVASRQNAG